jgi:hypothetical protein
VAFGRPTRLESDFAVQRGSVSRSAHSMMPASPNFGLRSRSAKELQTPPSAPRSAMIGEVVMNSQKVVGATVIASLVIAVVPVGFLAWCDSLGPDAEARLEEGMPPSAYGGLRLLTLIPYQATRLLGYQHPAYVELWDEGGGPVPRGSFSFSHRRTWQVLLSSWISWLFCLGVVASVGSFLCRHTARLNPRPN